MSKSEYIQFTQDWKDQLPIYFQPWYLDGACSNGYWDAVCVKKGQQLVGVFPYAFKKRWGFTYSTIPTFVKFLGPWLIPKFRDHQSSEPILKALIEQLPPLDGFKCTTDYTVENWMPLYWSGFKQTTHYSYQLPLEEESVIHAGLNRNIRRNLRKAASFFTIEQSEDLELFFSLNQMSFERQGAKTPYNFEQLKRHDDALREKEARAIFLARDQQGKVHSGAYLIWDKHSAYYHLSGDEPETRQMGGGILLIQHSIRYARDEKQLSWFDFEGSMIPGVAAVRRQFGAFPRPYFVLWKYNNRWYRWLDSLKKNL